MYLLGSEFSTDKDNFINIGENKISVSQEFDFEGQSYRVRATKSKFELSIKHVIAGQEKFLPVGEPISTLKKLIGHIGLSPMSLKEKNGSLQVKELRKALDVSNEVEEEETKIKKDFEVAKNARTAFNREFTRLQKVLSENEMYVAWEESEKKYAEQKTSEGEKIKMIALELKKNQFSEAQQRLSNHERNINSIKNDIEEIEKQIEELKRKKETKNEELSQSESKKEIAETWIEENKSIEADYAKAQEEYRDIERYLINQSQWEAVKKQKAEMDDMETEVQKADTLKYNLSQELLKIAKKGLPDIEGLEVITEDSIDGKDAGVYLNGRNLSQLSESEIWGLYLNIYKANNVSFVFIENISGLGSEAVNILNELAAAGVRIFASQMVRGQNELKIVMTDTIK